MGNRRLAEKSGRLDFAVALSSIQVPAYRPGDVHPSGKRVGYKKEPFRPHNLPFTVLGPPCCGSDGLVLMRGAPWPPTIWPPTLLWRHTSRRPPRPDLALIECSSMGADRAGRLNGAVAGLVAITPACGFVNPMNAIFIGML